MFLPAEFVFEEVGDGFGEDANAGYAEADWIFREPPWSPGFNDRYASVDESYGPLFYGFNRGYDTQFQVEVASR